MARIASSRTTPRSGRSGPRSKRPRRGSKGHAGIVYGLLIVISLVVLGIGGFMMWRAQQAEHLDTSLCPAQSGPSGHLLILLDLTDPVAPADQTRIRNIVMSAVDQSPEGTLTALGVVSADAARMGAQFSLCKPRSGRDADELTENRRIIERRYRDGFAAPLEAALDTMLSAPSEDRSPIMEGVQALAASVPGFLGSDAGRRLIVASDLLQNSSAMSFYRGEDWSAFEHSPGYAQLSRNLNGVEVELLHIQRPESTGNPAPVREFWAMYFEQQGAGRIRETVIGGY